MSTKTWREHARSIIGPVILAMTGRTRKELRKELRAAYPRYATKKSGHAYKIWCEEVAFALRDRSRRSYKRHKVRRPEDVMKSARAWAAERGLVETLAVLDVDLPLEDPARPKAGGGLSDGSELLFNAERVGPPGSGSPQNPNGNK